MYNFCTLFDSNYLPKGLTLYKSILNQNIEFHLYILALDDFCCKTLNQLALSNVTVVPLVEIETEELLNIKGERNRAEYCWTIGPSAIEYFIRTFSLNECTYLDADLMFFNSPKIIFEEIENCSVAITEHIPGGPEMVAGKYCVQFVYFKNDDNGMKALAWWKSKCIEWCFARYENGKYGDQKYLESFPVLFDDVCVIKNVGAGVAPWNVHLYNFETPGTVKFNDQIQEIVFFHFHGARIIVADNKLRIKPKTSDLNYYLSENVYMEYAVLMRDTLSEYLDCKNCKIIIEDRSFFEKVLALLRGHYKDNKLMQFIYFKVLRKRYNGYS